jgi:hypothetical protein
MKKGVIHCLAVFGKAFIEERHHVLLVVAYEQVLALRPEDGASSSGP